MHVIFIYIKSKEFHSYSCAYIVILSISILVDNILRVIPIGRQDHINALSYIQAFILTSLDKYILLALTMQVFIIYLGIMKTESGQTSLNHNIVYGIGVYNDLCYIFPSSTVT